MLYVLLVAFIVAWAGVFWLVSEVNWSTGEWKQAKHKGQWFPYK